MDLTLNPLEECRKHRPIPSKAVKLLQRVARLNRDEASELDQYCDFAAGHEIAELPRCGDHEPWSMTCAS